MSNEFLFSKVDPLGYYVSLSSDQYHLHIIGESEHAGVKPEDICQCIVSPQAIYKSTYQKTDRMVYFSEYSSSRTGMLLKTVTELEDKASATVVTSFPVKKIGGGIDTSEGGLLYCDSKHKL